METLKKYWYIIVFLAPVISYCVVWAVRVDYHVKESLSPLQQQRNYIMDSLDKDSAIKTRAIRLERERKNDSIKHIGDSIILEAVKKNSDYVERNAVQINQIKELVER